MANNLGKVGCPHCGNSLSRTQSTRAAEDGFGMRRRRVCSRCGEGFITFEIRSADYTLLQQLRKLVDERSKIITSGTPAAAE